MLRRYEALETIRARIATAAALDTGLADTPDAALEVIWSDGMQPYYDGAVVRLSVVAETGYDWPRKSVDLDTGETIIFREVLFSIQCNVESIGHENQPDNAGDVLVGILDGLEFLADGQKSGVTWVGTRGAQVSRNYAFQQRMICSRIVDLGFRAGIGVTLSDSDVHWIESLEAVGTLTPGPVDLTVTASR